MKTIKQTITLNIRKADNSGNEDHDRVYVADVTDDMEDAPKTCAFHGDNMLIEFVTNDLIVDARQLEEGQTMKVTIITETPEPSE